MQTEASGQANVQIEASGQVGKASGQAKAQVEASRQAK